MDQNIESTQNTTSEAQTNVVNTVVTNKITTEPATQSMPATETTNINNNEKKNQWMPIVLIICAILAIGGVGFGIFAMTRASSLDGEIASLKSENSDLKSQLDTLTGDRTWIYQNEEDTEDEGARWSSVEVRDGTFYVLGADSQVIVQSNPNSPVVNELIDCSSSSNESVLNCAVITPEGQGIFTYDVYGGALIFSFDSEETH